MEKTLKANDQIDRFMLMKKMIQGRGVCPYPRLTPGYIHVNDHYFHTSPLKQLGKSKSYAEPFRIRGGGGVGSAAKFIQCVRPWFYQWYKWYNIVQGSTNGTIGNTIGTNGTIGKDRW